MPDGAVECVGLQAHPWGAQEAGVVATYRRHFNDCRPHQGVENRVPQAVRTGEPMPEAVNGPIGTVYCDEFLGGLLKSYRRAAA
jgi:hypothetical protein